MQFVIFPQPGGGQSHEAAPHPGAWSLPSLDREQLSKDYKAALKLKAEGQQCDAVSALTTLRGQLPETGGRAASREEASWQTWRDQAWGRHLRYLCDLSLAQSHRELGQHAEALNFLFAALDCSDVEEFQRSSSLHTELRGEWSLWDAVADSAVQAEDWNALKLSCEKCLTIWPGDLAKLRCLIRALLQLGLNSECVGALEALQEVAQGSGSEAFGEREAWLLNRLRRDLNLEEAREDLPMAPEFEAGYDTLCEQRRKRLRSDTAPPRCKAKHVLVEELSVSWLLEDCRKMVLTGLPPNHPVIFVRQETTTVSDKEMASDEAGGDCIAQPNRASSTSSLDSAGDSAVRVNNLFADPDQQSRLFPEAQSVMPEGVAAASTGIWESLDPLLADQGHRRRQVGSSRWVLQLLNDAAVPQTAHLEQQAAQRLQQQVEAAAKDASRVAHMLEFSASGPPRSESPCRAWRSWLLRILLYVMEHQVFLQVNDKKQRLIACVVQLAVSLIMLCSPLGNSASVIACLQASDFELGGDSFQNWHGRGWLNDDFLRWLGYEDENASELVNITKPAHQIAIFLRKWGMALAELCMDSKLRTDWASQMSVDFLQVWLRICPHAKAIAQIWLVRASDSDQAAEKNGSEHKLPSDLLALMEADSLVCQSIVRCLWCLSLQRKPTEAETLLQLCQEALGVCQTEVTRASGGTITASACAQRISARCRPGSEPEIVIEDEGDQDHTFKGNLLELCQYLMGTRLPTQFEPWSAKLNFELEDLFRFSKEFLRGLSDESCATAATNGSTSNNGLAMLLEVFSRITSHLVAGFCSVNARMDRDMVRMDKLIRVLRLSADLVEVAQRRADFITTTAAGDAVPIFSGIAGEASATDDNTASPQTNTVWCRLAQPCECMVLACLLLADQVAAGKMPPEFCPVAHACTSLAMKLCGILLLAAGAALRPCTGKAVRGGAMLLYHGAESAAAPCSDEDAKVLRHIPTRALWLHLCHFLAAGQDLAIALGLSFHERFRRGGAGESLYSQECSLKVFGEPRAPGESAADARLCTTLEAPLSLPNIICTCALHVGCDTLAAWREDLTSWRERASQNLSKAPSQDSEKAARAQSVDERMQTEPVQVCSASDRGSNHRAIDQKPAWRRTLRALRGADGEAPAPNLEFEKDEEVDEATCKLVARALVCLWPLPGVDPVPPAKFPSNAVCRFLMELAVYRSTKAAELSEAAKCFEPDVFQHALPPHVLLLAREVHHRLMRAAEKAAQKSEEPMPTSSLRKHVIFHLDHLLFPEAYKGREGDPIPQVFFHPLLMPRSLLQGKDSRQGVDAAFQDRPAADSLHLLRPYFNMMIALRAKDAASAEGACAAGGYPPEMLTEGLPGLADAFKRIDDKVKEFCKNEWTLPPEGAKSQAKWLDEQDRAAGRSLLECLCKIPALPVPTGLQELYSSVVMAVSVRQPSKSDVTSKETKSWFETIAWAAKNFLLKPCDWETWTKVATIFKWLYNAYDDHVAKIEPWNENFQRWMQSQVDAIEFHWRDDLQALYSNARLLNLMLLARLEDELLAAMAPAAGTAAPPATSEVPSAAPSATLQCTESASQSVNTSALAKAWVDRQLDLLELYSCRRLSLAPQRKERSPQRGAQQTHLLVQRCDQISRRVLWFLVHCTDLGTKIPKVAELIEKHKSSWPQPAFVKHWETLDSRPAPAPLLHFTKRRPPPYLWNIPYLAARCQWKLLVASSPDTVGPEGILTLLSAAVDIEKWSFSIYADKQMALGPQAVFAGERQYEADWKKLTMMLKIVRTRPLEELNFLEGASVGSSTIKQVGPETPQVVEAACLRALESIVQKKSFYKFPWAVLNAKLMASRGNYADAAECVAGIFSVPHSFPLDRSRIGLHYIRDNEKCSQGSDGSEDLCWQHAHRHRRYNLVRAKALMFIINLPRKAIRKVTGDMDVFAQPSFDLNNSGSDAVVKILTGLCNERPADWKDLHQTMGLHVMIVRGMRMPHPASQNLFWTAFLEGYRKCLCANFSKLLEPNYGSRPCLDWQLLAQLRSCCFAMKACDADVAVQKQFTNLFATAMSDVKSYVRKHVELPKELTAVKFEDGADGAEAFFRQLAPKMAEARGRWGSSLETFEGSQVPTPMRHQDTSVCHVLDSDSEGA